MSRDVSVKAFAVALAVAASLLALPCAEASGSSRAHAVIAGSSTIFPFAAAVAERQPAPPPLVLSMGSGAGIAWFCEGLGPNTPDIAAASRRMLPEEASACRVNGVASMQQYELGRDGIVLVSQPSAALRELALDELWLALADRVPDPASASGWVPNPYRTWREIGADLPATPIRVFGPPATSGTRDVLIALGLRPACEAALAARPDGPGARSCGQLRRDGAWIEAGENDDGLVVRVQDHPGALGVVGFGALARNPGRVAAICLDGHCPGVEAIASGDYPLARSLFLYVKPGHRAFVPGLDAVVAEFLSPEARGPGGYLARLGLVAPGGEAPDAVALEGRMHESRRDGPALRVAAGALALVLLALVLGTVLTRRPRPANLALERIVVATLWSSAALAGLVLALVLASMVVPTVSFFLQVSPLAFLGGTHWSPDSAIRASQVIGEGAFGVLPVLLGSVLVAVLALLISVPLALAAALHSFAWAGSRFRSAWRVGIRLAALVPTVVYGLFAALTVGPAVVTAAAAFGASAAIENTLAAGLVVGIMLLPVLSARISEALEAVPQGSAEAAIGLGATRWEALRDVLLPAAGPGIGAAILLALGRALGETVIVLMALGLAASWGIDPLQSTTTLTVQMASLMSGTHALDNVRTQLPFVLGLFLAVLVLPLNAWALRMLRRSNVTPSPLF